MSARHSETLPMSIVHRAVLLVAALALFSFAFAATAGRAQAAALTITSNNTFPISLLVDACGEPVALSGELHDLFHVTLDGAGGAHLDVHDNPQGVSGTDLVTLAKYQGTGVTRSDENFTAGGTVTFTLVNNFRIIGQSQSANFDVHDNFHVTVNPDGTVTSFHDNFSITCH